MNSKQQLLRQIDREFTLIQKNIEKDEYVVVTLTEIRKGTVMKFVGKIKEQCLEDIHEEAYDITYLRNYRNHQDSFVFPDIPDDNSFWRNEPELWFLRLEAQFRQAKIISDNCKFDHTVASLNSDILIEVADIVKNPTADSAYTQLKARLLERYGISSDKRIYRLMELTLGDLKPTQLLYRMQALATDSISTQVLKNFWLDRVPPSVRSVISVLDGDLEELAKKADRYLRCSSFPVMAVTESPTLDKAVAALNDQVSGLSNRLAVDEERQQIQMVKSTKSSSDEQCYYHRRFGAQAKKCRPPCSFTKNDERAH
ncbi:uncharacterized protein LOC126880855 [Diabrotica virgifera virgifera]|uniref:DUF7041 domain-containing protein n=1 Tax=Diabrotica virgifera virgifera TaxID=50390 RepID=A0ABM5JSH6_DIAVI|nr:uncharacterized protein LOC126880855 [Diabrotica virgifera virgifera]